MLELMFFGGILNKILRYFFTIVFVNKKKSSIKKKTTQRTCLIIGLQWRARRCWKTLRHVHSCHNILSVLISAGTGQQLSTCSSSIRLFVGRKSLPSVPTLRTRTRLRKSYRVRKIISPESTPAKHAGKNTAPSDVTALQEEGVKEE